MNFNDNLYKSNVKEEQENILKFSNSSEEQNIIKYNMNNDVISNKKLKIEK